MDRTKLLFATSLLTFMYAHGALGKESTYALVVLPKPGINTHLMEALTTGLARVASATPGLHVKLPEEVNRLLKDDARHALVECHGDIKCIAGIAGRVGTDALMLARVSPSTVADGGIVMQVLILNKEGHSVERKCFMELADAKDVDLSLHANHLSLFGMTSKGAVPKMPQPVAAQKKAKGDSNSPPGLEDISDRVEDLELTLATFDTSNGATAGNLEVLDGLITATQGLLAQLQSVLEHMDATATPRWLRPRPRDPTLPAAPAESGSAPSGDASAPVAVPTASTP